MTREDAIKIIRKELLCVDRDTCKREECKSCDLVMPSKEPIIEAYQMAIKALENQCPSKGGDCEDCPANELKSEWEQDHAILKAYSDGANDVLDKIRAEVMQLDYDIETIGFDLNSMPADEMVHTICREEVLQIIDKYKESEEIICK